jgi:hypothetical protein
MGKRLITLLLVSTATASGAWIYAGKWGSRGTGNGQFIRPMGICVTNNGNVYVGWEYA